MVFIQLCNFSVHHILCQKHIEVDGILQWFLTKLDIAKAQAKPDMDDFILAKLNCSWVFSISINQETPLLKNSYSDLSQKIATYLKTIYIPFEMTFKDLISFKKQVFKFKVQDKHHFENNSRNLWMGLVIESLI